MMLGDKMNKLEVCAYLGISRTTLDRWIQKYGIKHVKIGNKYYFDKDVIDKFVEDKSK